MDVVIEPRMHSLNGRKVPHRMLIPSRAMVEARIGSVPAGASGSVAEIRRSLAEQFGADACCPVTTQRHLRAIAEDVVSGRSATPYWRVVDPEMPSLRNFAGGQEFVRKKRQAEARSRA